MEFFDAIHARRTRYDLTDAIPVSDERVEAILSEIMLCMPSSFHSQSARAVLLFGARSKRLWEIVTETLRAMVPADKFKATETKINGFAAGHGTILYLEEMETVSGLQKNFPGYAEHFPTWSMQSAGMLQFAVWSALAQEGIGASLQHYNPIIDAAVHAEFDLPESWKLLAQMPFGIPSGPVPAPLKRMPIEERLRVQKG